MPRFTFSGGVHPFEGKEMSKDKPITSLDAGQILVYPVSQHICAPAKPIVQVGERVLIARRNA